MIDWRVDSRSDSDYVENGKSFVYMYTQGLFCSQRERKIAQKLQRRRLSWSVAKVFLENFIAKMVLRMQTAEDKRYREPTLFKARKIKIVFKLQQ